jgi:hypothetical protein
MTKPLTKIPIKLLFFFVFACLCFSCGEKKIESKVVDNQGDTKQTNNKSTKIVLPDSLVQKILDNKLDTLPVSILQFFSKESASNCLSYKIEQVNLDEEISKEIILFVMYGNLQPNDIYILKKDIKGWQIFDKITISTNVGNLENSFLIDNENKLIITQWLGRGSANGGTFNEFYKMSNDTLAHLLSLTEHEWKVPYYNFDTILLYKKDFNCSEQLQSTYKIVNSKNIVVDYDYYFGLDDEANEVTILSRNFQLSYQLDSITNKFGLMPNQKIGEILVQNNDNISVLDFNFFEAYQKDIESLRKNGTKKQRYYIKYFNH